MQALTPHVFPKFYTIQFLRFVAALFVMFFHLNIMGSGYKGVDVFFVISGFVMYYSTLIVTHKSVQIFLLNRLTKIYILYWLVLLAWYFVKPFKISGAFLGAFLLIPGHFPYIKVSWSLSYELYFYFAFAAIVYLITRKIRLIFIAFFFISSVVTFLQFTTFSLQGSLFNFLLGENFWEFLLGIFCCILATKVSVNYRLAIICCAVVGIVITIVSVPYATTLGHVVYGPLAFLLVFFIVEYEKKAVLNKYFIKAVTTLGDASYAIYLVAPLIADIIFPVHLPGKLLTMAAAIAISIIVNRYIETPLLVNGRRLVRMLIKK